LKNGDKITGSVIKKDAKSLTFKSDAFGAVTVAWDKVQSLSAEKPVYVVLPGDRTILGTIQSKDDRLEITSKGVRQDTSLADLMAIRDSEEQAAYERLLDPSWTELWAGSATLAWAGAAGNAKSATFASAFTAARVTNTDKTTIQFNAIRASATVNGVSASTARAVRGGWGYNRNLAARVIWNVFNDYDYDPFQNLDLRFVLGGGFGFIAVKTERARLDLLGGTAYDRESFGATGPLPAFTRNSVEAYFGDEFTFKLSPVTSLYQNARFFENLSTPGEYRLNGDFGANTRLTRWLTWNATVSNRLLSNPAPGRKRNDILYTTGIGVTFAR